MPFIAQHAFWASRQATQLAAFVPSSHGPEQGSGAALVQQLISITSSPDPASRDPAASVPAFGIALDAASPCAAVDPPHAVVARAPPANIISRKRCSQLMPSGAKQP